MKRTRNHEARLAALENRLAPVLGPPVINVLRIDGDPLNPRPIQSYAGLSFGEGGPGVSPDDPPEENWSVQRQDGESDEALYRRAVEAAIKCKGRGLPLLLCAVEGRSDEPLKATGVAVGQLDGSYRVE